MQFLVLLQRWNDHPRVACSRFFSSMLKSKSATFGKLSVCIFNVGIPIRNISQAPRCLVYFNVDVNIRDLLQALRWFVYSNVELTIRDMLQALSGFLFSVCIPTFK